MTSEATKKMIKLRSVELGIPLAQLARELGVSRQFLYQVCVGLRPTARIRNHICQRLDLNPVLLGWDDQGASSSGIPARTLGVHGRQQIQLDACRVKSSPRKS